ncbi:hypothetical protein ACOMHN_010188 [Nucella lapillus]
MGKLVLTNAVCWFSFGLVTFPGLRRLSVFHKIHGVLVVLVLPLSSALNPLLYLWTVVTQWRGRAKETKLLQVFKSRLVQQGKKQSHHQ